MDSNLELRLQRKSQRKRPSLKGRDLISCLPDHVIARVISFLETKEAIRTCVLSSRWRDLWKGISRIHLTDYHTDPEKLSNLVEHVLWNCSSTNFVAVELYCPLSIGLSHLNAWIGCIVGHKIETLILCVKDLNNHVLPELPLPQFILSYTTLVHLKLICFDIQIPELLVCFPCLKELDLHVVFPDSVVVVNRLLSSCPVLEKMFLFGFIYIKIDSLDEFNINVSIATLKRLTLHLRNVGSRYAKKQDVIINTPNLESLSIDDESSTKYVVNNLPRVSSVYINKTPWSVTDPDYGTDILALFEQIVVTKLLRLHLNTVKVLGLVLRYTWPTFRYLKTLIMHLNDFSERAGFSQLLHSAPILNVLILDLGRISDVVYDRSLYHWTKPDSVPKCLLEHLKIVAIQHFEGNKGEVQVVKYLLNNALVLEHMMISYESDKRREKVSNELLMSPRASKKCYVKIYRRIHYDIDTALAKVSIWGI